jgi:two-component system sensor kinase FixL
MHDPWSDISLIVSNAQDAIIGETASGEIASWNTGAVRLLGYAASDMIGARTSVLSPGNNAAAAFPGWIARLRAHECIPPFEDEYICKNGSVSLVSVALSPVFDGRDRLIGLSRIARAIEPADRRPDQSNERRRSEQRRVELERELFHLARWCAMGQMATALAHELNQPLTAIVCYLTAARQFLADSDTVGEGHESSILATALDNATDQARRAAHIIRHLRCFVSRDDDERQPVLISVAIMQASELVAIAARHSGVAIEFNLAADGLVLIDRVQIQQVVFNLMRNAIEAMATASPRVLWVSTQLNTDVVQVSITDTGTGLTPAVQSRLFQPFLTSKPDGMGVGLSICHAIIKAHVGELWLGTSSSHGTTFHFSLPLASTT